MVSARVVDLLEVVHVHQQERDRTSVPVRARQLEPQMLHEIAAIRQLRQRISQRQLPCFLERNGVVDDEPHLRCEMVEEALVVVPRTAVGSDQGERAQQPAVD